MGSDHDDLVELGAVVRPHGLTGALSVKLFNPASDLLLEMSELVVLFPDGERERHAVRSAARHGHGVILSLEGVQGRDRAEGYKHARLAIERAALPPAEEGEYYFVDLIGLSVRDAEGGMVGEVVDVIDYPSVACLVVRREDGSGLEVPDLDRYLLEVRPEEGYVVAGHLDELEALETPPPKRRR